MEMESESMECPSLTREESQRYGRQLRKSRSLPCQTQAMVISEKVEDTQ